MGSFFFTTAWSQNSDIFIDDTLKAAQLNPRLVQRFPILDATPNAVKRSPDPLIDIEFGTLNPKQFKLLNNFYRSMSLVPYKENRKYFLTDFLTPQMQALLGKDFHSEMTIKKVPSYYDYLFEEINVPNSKTASETVISTAQCWGTAWNNLYILQNQSPSTENQSAPTTILKFNILFLETDAVNDYLLNDKYSTKIDSSEPRQYGDLLGLLAEKTNLANLPLHFSLYVGFGLVFEKQDNSIGKPYRVVNYETSFKNQIDAIRENPNTKDFKVIEEARRFLGPQIEKLPEISRVSPLFDQRSYKYFGRTSARMSSVTSETLGGANKPELSLNTPIRFQIDPKSGRGKIRSQHTKYFSEAYTNN